MSTLRFSFSNIAWSPHDDAEILALLRRQGITGIEIAPTAVWGNWELITVEAAASYRTFLRDEGFDIPALQALLYGKPQARLFDREGESKLLEHLTCVGTIAGALGAPVAVLGAPTQRDRGNRSWQQALSEAVPVLRRAAGAFADHGCCLCIEPNPAAYGCNFVRTAGEGAELVTAVDHPGFGLHLDAGALFMERENLRSVLPAVAPLLKHFHLSEPSLGHFSAPEAPHLENLRCLQEAGYSGWCSFEMRRPALSLSQVGPWALLAQARGSGDAAQNVRDAAQGARDA